MLTKPAIPPVLIPTFPYLVAHTSFGQGKIDHLLRLAEQAKAGGARRLAHRIFGQLLQLYLEDQGRNWLALSFEADKLGPCTLPELRYALFALTSNTSPELVLRVPFPLVDPDWSLRAMKVAKEVRRGVVLGVREVRELTSVDQERLENDVAETLGLRRADSWDATVWESRVDKIVGDHFAPAFDERAQKEGRGK